MIKSSIHEGLMRDCVMDRGVNSICLREMQSPFSVIQDIKFNKFPNFEILYHLISNSGHYEFISLHLMIIILTQSFPLSSFIPIANINNS